MADRLLSERDVLNMMGWPSREFINSRIRSSGFPRPAVRYRGIGDQWRESDIETWVSGKKKGEASGNRLLERFG